jgi:COP9 signalosome complex subunit 1
MGESAREKVQAKLDLASALAYLGQGSYEKAARAFLKIKSIRALDDWAGKVGLDVGGNKFLTWTLWKIIAPADIAVAGVLCALATFTRSAVKAAVLESDTFSIFIEQETYVRDMLDAYMNSKFKQVLTILDRNYVRSPSSPFSVGTDVGSTG